MLVAEVAEVDGAGDGDHLSDAGRRPAGNHVPHALATCQREAPMLASFGRSSSFFGTISRGLVFISSSPPELNTPKDR